MKFITAFLLVDAISSVIIFTQFGALEHIMMDRIQNMVNQAMLP